MADAKSLIMAPSMNRKKLFGRAFYESIGSPKMILAPMVDQSEFVWMSDFTMAASKLIPRIGMAHAHTFLHES